ncbi:MAG: SPASM domain-containing protein [Deltaproteobacteria bacterium]|nr:SPASM domain-containing protein [Deltaproteobacteria bacterium]
MAWNPLKRKKRRQLGLDVPRGLTVELTSHCNYDCGPCPLNFYTMDVKRLHLNLDILEKRLGELPPLETIDLTGWGEGFLHPDFPRAVELAAHHAGDVSLTTAGLFLDRDRASLLIEHGISYVMVSLDAANRASYKALKHKDDFDRVVSNIEAFVGERSRTGRTRPQIAISCILTRETMPDWYALAELATALQVDQLVFKALAPMNPSELRYSLHHRFYPGVDAPALDPADELDRAIRRATGNGVEVAVFNDWAGDQIHPCMAYATDRPYLRSDGLMAPCCMLAYPLDRPLPDGSSRKAGPVSFGSWFEEPIENIWKKQDYIRFRDALDRHEPAEACLGCPVNHLFRLEVHPPEPIQS